MHAELIFPIIRVFRDTYPYMQKNYHNPNSQFLCSQHGDHNLICFSPLLQRMFLPAGQLGCGCGGMWSTVGGGDVPVLFFLSYVFICWKEKNEQTGGFVLPSWYLHQFFVLNKKCCFTFLKKNKPLGCNLLNIKNNCWSLPTAKQLSIHPATGGFLMKLLFRTKLDFYILSDLSY